PVGPDPADLLEVAVLLALARRALAGGFHELREADGGAAGPVEREHQDEDEQQQQDRPQPTAGGRRLRTAAIPAGRVRLLTRRRHGSSSLNRAAGPAHVRTARTAPKISLG